MSFLTIFSWNVRLFFFFLQSAEGDRKWGTDSDSTDVAGQTGKWGFCGSWSASQSLGWPLRHVAAGAVHEVMQVQVGGITSNTAMFDGIIILQSWEKVNDVRLHARYWENTIHINWACTRSQCKQERDCCLLSRRLAAETPMKEDKHTGVAFKMQNSTTQPLMQPKITRLTVLLMNYCHYTVSPGW